MGPKLVKKDKFFFKRHFEENEEYIIDLRTLLVLKFKKWFFIGCLYSTKNLEKQAKNINGQ